MHAYAEELANPATPADPAADLATPVKLPVAQSVSGSYSPPRDRFARQEDKMRRSRSLSRHR